MILRGSLGFSEKEIEGMGLDVIQEWKVGWITNQFTMLSLFLELFLGGETKGDIKEGVPLESGIMDAMQMISKVK